MHGAAVHSPEDETAGLRSATRPSRREAARATRGEDGGVDGPQLQRGTPTGTSADEDKEVAVASERWSDGVPWEQRRVLERLAAGGRGRRGRDRGEKRGDDGEEKGLTRQPPDPP